ncbi:MAG TPA: DUF5916 domain-containing protein [Gemmatimonadales bacterium]|nr:DUF5916 domain-containing protein [Gemmatimonadales bacterium]
MTTTLQLLLALVGVHPPAVAVDSPPPALPGPQQVRAIRLNGGQSITIDGMLREALWQSAERISGFTQRDPTEGAVPSESTVVFIAYDDAALYIGARLYDSHPDSIVSRLARRDEDASSDRFQVFIDPYHDKRSGFYFGISAAGTLYDGTLFNDEWDDNSWDGVWEGKVTRDELGWIAELRIPYSQLRFVRQQQYVWGINFRRDIARKNEFDYIAFTPKNGSGFVSRFPDLVGIERITPPRRVEVMPYTTGKAEFMNRAAGDPFNDGSKFSPGFGADARIGLGSNLTLNATVNPDFGQVEVDPAVVNLSDVETFFNEKRPFFVEGSSIFEFGFGGQRNFWGFNWSGPQFFYSRRIGRALALPAVPDSGYVDGPTGAHILGALKLTGKVAGSWNVGGLTAVTGREHATLQNGVGSRWNQEIEPLTAYGVYRVQKEFDKGRQGLGFVSTVAARAFDDPALRNSRNSSATVFGTDGWLFLDSSKTWVTTAWLAGSRITGSTARITDVQQNPTHYFQKPDASTVEVDPNATSLTGTAGRLTLAKQRGNTFVNSAFGFTSPGFEVNDLGFHSRTGYINAHVGGGRTWTKPGKIFRYAETGGALFRTYDWDGNINWSGLFNFGYAQFHNYFSINWNLAWNPWTVDNRRTRGGPLVTLPPGYQVGLDMATDSRKSLTLGFGTFTYIRSAEDFDWQGYVNLQYRPKANVQVTVGPQLYRGTTLRQYIDAFPDSTASATYDTRYVFGRLHQTELSAGIRLNWTYSPTLSLQLYAQPLISAGRYDKFRELARPRSNSYNEYGRDNSSSIAFVDSTNSYEVDPDGAGPAQVLSFGKPDFNFKSLRGNAVLRWEYMPGSTLYFVWTQSRADFEDSGDFRFGSSMSRMLRAPAENIFMVKATYWWNP